jgi:hypothetical protein
MREKMIMKRIFGVLLVMVLVMLGTLQVASTPVFASGPAPVNLGSAAGFVVLSKTGISTTGTSSIVGNIGVSPIASTAITGFGLILDSSGQFSTSSLVNGKIYAANYAPPTPTKMTTAVSDMQTAYTNAAGRTTPAPIVNLGAGNIGGLTLAPGLYKWSTGLVIPTTVTLSGGANDVWIFQIAQDLTVSSSVTVTLMGGAQAENIFWQVGGKVTLGTTSHFVGVILCQTLIAMNTGATLDGRALAQTAVTLIANIVSVQVATVTSVSGWVSSSYVAALPVSNALSSGPHGDQSTTSTTFTASQESVSVVSSGGQQYLVLGTSQLWDSSPSVGPSMGVCRDGALISGDQFSLGAYAGYRHLASAVVVDTPSAGSHTYTLCYKTDPGGTGFVSSTYLVLVPVSGAFQSGPHGDQSTTSTAFTPSLETLTVPASGSQQYLALASSQLWSDSVSVGSSMAVCRDGSRISGDMFQLGSTIGDRQLPLAVAVDTPAAGSHTYALCSKTDPGGRGWVSSTFLVVVPVSGASSSGPFGDQSTTSTTFTPSSASMSITTSGGGYLLLGTSQLWNDVSTTGSSMGVSRDGALISGDQFGLGATITRRDLASALALDTPSSGSHTYSLCFKTDP